jgi:hypothetical protein
MIRFLLPLLAAAALAAPPPNPGDDLLFGEVRLSGNPGQDVLVLPRCDDSWNAPVGRLILELHGAPFYLHEIRVRVDGEVTRTLKVDDTLYPHRPPTFVDVGGAACVTRIDFRTDPKLSTPARQPTVRITGEVAAPAPPPPPEPAPVVE